MSYPNDPGFIDRDTSRAAAESMKVPAATLREDVFATLENSTGMTCEEVEKSLGLQHQTISARMTELKLAKRIVDSGLRRPTSSGRMAKVMRVRADDTD